MNSYTISQFTARFNELMDMPLYQFDVRFWLVWKFVNPNDRPITFDYRQDRANWLTRTESDLLRTYEVAPQVLTQIMGALVYSRWTLNPIPGHMTMSIADKILETRFADLHDLVEDYEFSGGQHRYFLSDGSTLILNKRIGVRLVTGKGMKYQLARIAGV